MEALNKIKPVVGRRVREGQEDWFVLVDKLEVGELVRVLPGEIIPMDGVIFQGESTISLAPLSNEYSVRSTGHRVCAGTYNSRSEIIIKITTDFAHCSFHEFAANHKEGKSNFDFIGRFLSPALQ